MKLLAILSVMFLVFVGLPHAANAQTQGFDVSVTVRGHTGVVAGSSSDNFLSFSGPIEIPGVGLAPGTYIFRLVTPSIVQVLSENRSTVYAMFFVTPVQRREATDRYTVTLRSVLYDAPPRITTMFPANSLQGFDVPYPKMTFATGLIVAMR